MLSALEQLSSHTRSLPFGELLRILREHGHPVRARRYEDEVTIEGLLSGIDNPLELTIEEVVKLFITAEDKELSRGWDNAFRGTEFYGRRAD